MIQTADYHDFNGNDIGGFNYLDESEQGKCLPDCKASKVS